jgi:hypothetical protein
MAHKIYVEQENGEIRTINITELGITESPKESINPENDRETYGIKEDAIAHLQEVHETIRLYTRYAIGAFKNLGEGEVTEVKLKFGLKIGGEAGIPILTKASAESNFEIEVKCTFPPPTRS